LNVVLLNPNMLEPLGVGFNRPHQPLKSFVEKFKPQHPNSQPQTANRKPSRSKAAESMGLGDTLFDRVRRMYAKEALALLSIQVESIPPSAVSQIISPERFSEHGRFAAGWFTVLESWSRMTRHKFCPKNFQIPNSSS
jgi:hypothetical protein